jgi:hypothetical protein
MAKLKLKFDSATVERIRKVSEVGGYSSPEEFLMHVIERELDTLDPGQGESEEEIRKKLEGLGYIE